MKNHTRIGYDKVAVDRAISASSRNGQTIDAAEARQIHRLLSGRHETKPGSYALAEKIPPVPGGEVTMSRERFTLGLARLGYNISTAHRLLGMGRSTIYRMADGTSAVPMVVIKLMDMYERFGVPPEHRQ